jgi:hypothetical protein
VIGTGGVVVAIPNLPADSEVGQGVGRVFTARSVSERGAFAMAGDETRLSFSGMRQLVGGERSRCAQADTA